MTTTAETHNQLALEFLKLARIEVVERIKLRDQSLLLYITTIGAYLAYVISKHYDAAVSIELKFLLIGPLPLISWTFTLIILAHHDLISNLTMYIEREIHFVRPDGSGELDIQPWNTSQTYIVTSSRGWALRFIAQIIVLVLPASYGIYFAARQFYVVPNDLGVKVLCALFFAVDIVFSIWTISLHVKSKRIRTSLLDALLKMANSSAKPPLSRGGKKTKSTMRKT